MPRKASVAPVWSIEPLPSAANSYINSVGVSANAPSVICGTCFYNYDTNLNHTPSATTFLVGVLLYNA
jgi:hypothetical protein